MDVDFRKLKKDPKPDDQIDLSQINTQLKTLNICDKEFLENSNYGNVQYNANLSQKSETDCTKIKSQMAFRLEEGNGECFYELGVTDAGEKIGLNEQEMKESIDLLEKVAVNLDSTFQLLKFYNGKVGLIAEILIRKKSLLSRNSKRVENSDIKIGLFGEESCGKSTLVGVLVNNNLDNGEGSARQNIFRFQHELQCGKTSSLSHQIIGFDQKGNIINSQSWEEIIQNSLKLISFYDLGGSEKAYKTTLSTLSPDYIDYFFLVVSAKQGITENTKLFLTIANYMNLPIITIFTMTDLVNSSDVEELVKNYKFLIKTLKFKKVPLIVNSYDDILLFSRNLDENIHPVIIVSSKTGNGFEFLINFLSTVPSLYSIKKYTQCLEDSYRYNMNYTESPCQFDIHEYFTLEKENNGRLIIGGIVSKGKIIVGEKYYLGPLKNGDFMIVEVNDIHCKKISVQIAYEGQFSSISVIKTNTFSGLKCEDVRKGMCLLDVNMSVPYSCRSFTAEIWSIDQITRNVKYKYEPVVTIKHVRQTCKLKKYEGALDDSETDYNSINKEDEDYDEEQNSKKKKMLLNKNNKKDETFSISPDNKILINFEFKNYLEYITTGSHVIINDGHLKAFGVIVKINK